MPYSEAVTLYFPDVHYFQWDYFDEVSSEVVGDSFWGAAQTMEMEPPRWRFSGTLTPMATRFERRQIRDFLVETARLRLYPFYIFQAPEEEWAGLLVGTGDGIEDGPFQMPIKGGYGSGHAATVTAVYLDGAPLTVNDYTISFLAGLETLITFATPPGAGVVITFDGVGRRRHGVRLDPSVTRQTFIPSGDNVGLRQITATEIL